MAKKKIEKKEKRSMLTDKELIEKYEAGQQPISELISIILSKPKSHSKRNEKQ